MLLLMTDKDIDGSHRCLVHRVSSSHHILSRVADSQTCLDIENGPIFAADIFNTENGEQKIFLVAHHL
jgi:hypothetical protein